MSLDVSQFRDLIAETLEKIEGFYNPQAVEMLLGTAAAESKFGTCLVQYGGGPAIGFFQMEPDTMFDIYDNYLCYRQSLRDKIAEVCGFVGEPTKYTLKTNLALQILLCRVHYLRVKEALPKVGELDRQAEYWKSYYNTYKGHGTVKGYVNAYEKYVLS